MSKEKRLWSLPFTLQNISEAEQAGSGDESVAGNMAYFQRKISAARFYARPFRREGEPEARPWRFSVFASRSAFLGNILKEVRQSSALRLARRACAFYVHG